MIVLFGDLGDYGQQLRADGDAAFVGGEIGIILEAMGFPTSMFTPIFAVARTVGWISQWKEMIADPQMKIGRPRQLYIGETMRDYTDVEDR